MVALQPFPALGGPDVLDLVDRRERRHTGWKFEPGQLGSREDVHVGCDRGWIIERPRTHEQAVARHDVIAAPQIGSAPVAEEDVVVLSAASGKPERLRSRVVRLDELLLDPDVDHERAAGHTLAIAAVTGVNDQRIAGQLVSDGLAGTCTLQCHPSSFCSRTPSELSRGGAPGSRPPRTGCSKRSAVEVSPTGPCVAVVRRGNLAKVALLADIAP